MSANMTPSPERQSFGERMSLAFTALLRALVRLILIVLVAGIIGLALWWGIPRLYQQYVVPVEDNALQIDDLRAQQSQDAQQLNDRLNELQSRLDNMDVLRDQDKQTFAELQDRLEDFQAQVISLENVMIEQEGGLSENLARLDEMDNTFADLEDALDQLGDAIGAVSSDLEGVATNVADNRLQSLSLEEAFNAAENPLNSLRRELNLLKVMELITRSRVFISQNNLGLLEQDLLTARDILINLQPQVPEYQQEALQTIINRLDLALSNLPGELDLVENDLEVAWQLLVEGLPTEPSSEPVEGGEGTPLPEGTPTVTPETTPEVTPTPTP